MDEKERAIVAQVLDVLRTLADKQEHIYNLLNLLPDLEGELVDSIEEAQVEAEYAKKIEKEFLNC
jgi:hypothetical protein